MGRQIKNNNIMSKMNVSISEQMWPQPSSLFFYLYVCVCIRTPFSIYLHMQDLVDGQWFYLL